MDKDDDAYVQPAASVFSTVECQILDHHLSLPLKLQDSPTKPGSNCSGAHVIAESNGHHHHHQQQQQQTYGSDLMGKFFLDSMNMGLQPPSKAFNGNSDKDEELQEQAGFDPICFLKLPLQKITAKGDNPFVDFRLSTYNHPEEGDGIAPSEVTNSYQTCRNTVNSPPNQGEDDYNSADYDDNTTTHPHPNHHLSISTSDQELTGFNPQANCNDMVMGMTHNKERKKRSRTCKSSEEVESQRMTHIAVERNRRKQMNEHLRVLRQLMPGSYVQRGDQASIIGGAIEFVKELEQLLQCLESQKRRRMYADYQHYLQMTQLPTNNNATTTPLLPMPEGPTKDDVADLKSPVADVEVKLMGLDAVIKILSQRRPGQLLKTISALQNNLRFSILHTNITTIEHTVLYSFNVKVSIDQRSTAEEIATSIQHIFSMIHASSINT